MWQVKFTEYTHNYAIMTSFFGISCYNLRKGGMGSMLNAMEKELCIAVSEKDRKKIMDLFKLGRTTQLPVVENKKLVGILDLFDYIDESSDVPKISDIMFRDVIIAGKDRSVFSFSTKTRQNILPFVDENEELQGYISQITIKCYLPSREYMQVIEESSSIYNKITEEGEIDFDRLKRSFDAIFESNYDGLYITVEPGKTLGINRKCAYVEGITADMISVGDEDLKINADELISENNAVTLVQNIQKKSEISVLGSEILDGGIVRVINNMNDFNRIKRELEKTRQLAEKYQTELNFLKCEVNKPNRPVFKSYSMKKIVNLARQVAKVESTVLIQGASGTGKGVLSRLIHDSSSRKNNGFFKINCGSIPEALLESELFGYEKGAFTGADEKGKAGLVEMADKGTLFLDEVGELPFNLQAKLLNVIQDREIIRIGGTEPVKVDVRIIAATNRNLEEMVTEKQFREDLYYRLNVIPIEIPPLKERKDDVIPLLFHAVDRFNKKYDFDKSLDPDVIRELVKYDWPGNVRELENLVEFLIVTTQSDIISVDDLPKNITGGEVAAGSMFLLQNAASLKEATDMLEKELLSQAMELSRNITETAALLKIDRTTAMRKMKKHGLEIRFENS